MNRLFSICLLAVVALMIATPLWAENNLSWTPTGGSQDLSSPANWTQFDPRVTDTNPTLNRLFINKDFASGQYPIFDGLGAQSTLDIWDLLIGTDGEGWATSDTTVDPPIVYGPGHTLTGEGYLSQTGGTINLKYAMRVGRAGWDGGVGSNGTFDMSGGVFHKYDNGGNVEFGIGSGVTGTFNISNGSVFTMDYNALLIGTGGGTGYLNMTGNGTAISTRALAIGNGSPSSAPSVATIGSVGGTDAPTINMAEWFNLAAWNGNGTLNMNNGTINVAGTGGWHGIGTQNGHATINMTGDSSFNTTGSTYWATIVGGTQWDGDDNSSANITLSGNAKITSSVQWLAGHIWGGTIGNKTTDFTLTMSGNSLLQVSSLSVADGNYDDAYSVTRDVEGVPTVFGPYAQYATGTITMSDTATITTGDFGLGNGGHASLTMNPGTTVNSTGWFGVGGAGINDHGRKGEGTLTATGATINSNVFFPGRQGTKGTVTLTAGALLNANDIIMGEGAWNGQNCNVTLSATNSTIAANYIRPYNDAALAVLNLDGATLIAKRDEGAFISKNTSYAVNILAGGVTVNTNYNIGIAADLKEDLVSTGGGLTKTGVGTLTLSGLATNYTGPTEVSAGKLLLACGNVSGDLFWGVAGVNAPNEITVRTGAAVGNDYIGYNPINANLHLEAKSTISVGVNGAPYVSPLSIQDISNVGATSAPVLIDLNLQDPNVDLSGLSGSVVLNYATEGANGAVPTFLPKVDSIGQTDWTYTDSLGGLSAGTVTLTLASSTRGWQVATTDNWNDAANWAEGVVPNGTAAKAWLADHSGAVPGVVTLDTNVTLSSLLLKGGYTINPATSESITLDTTLAANTLIQSLGGANVVNANIAMADGDPVIVVTPDSSLALNGVLSNLSGAAGISFDGKGSLSGDQWDAGYPLTITQGTLALTGANTFTGPVVMTGFGKLEIPTIGPSTSAGPLGMSSAAPANLVINGELALTATSATPVTYETDRGFTLAGTSYAYTDPQVHSGPGGYDIISVNENVTLKITGQTAVAAGMTAVFAKTGAGTLVLANTGTANVLSPFDLQVKEGTLVFDTGTYTKGRSNTYFQEGGGDIFVADTAGKTATLKVQNHAVLNNNAELNVGATGGTTGTLLVDNATLNSGLTRIGGGGATNTGNATLSNGGAMTVSSNIYVGPDGGIGNMALVSGSTLTSNNELYVGYNGGVGTMTVSNGSHIQVNGWSQIGRDSVSGIGSGTLTLNDTSTMTVTREFRLGRWGAGVGVMNMNDSSHLEMGGDEAWIGTDTGNGTLVMSGSSSANAGNNIQIGRNTGSTGTLTMSGSSSLWEANEFRLGWQGGTGNLNMSGTSYISANHFGNIGRDGGSSAIINMTGSSKMISRYWELSYGSNGGHAAVTMNGDNAADYVSIGNAAGYASDTYWISFGRDAGSTATLTMSGYSRVNTGYNVDIGVWGANATATMAGNAEILGGELNVGYEGTGSLVMSGSSANWINGEYRIGVGAGNGSVTIGSTTGTAIISVGGHLRVGYNGGTGTLNINPGASIGVNQWLQVGNNDGGGAGVGIVNMTGGTITKNAVADTFLIIGRTGTGTWTQSGGLADIRTGVTMGNGGYTGTLNLDGGVFSTGFIQAGYEADAAAIMRINFDGGTLKVNTDSIYAAAGGANFVTPYSSTDALITIEDGGAIVDTSGNDVAIAVNIAEDPLSTGGSFTKIGGGTLTLTGSVGYTGDTIVNVGGLTVNAGLNTPTATVYVANGTTLTTPSLVADTLVIGGGPYAAAATAAVPEPGTFVLLGLAGAIALLAIRRRK